MNLLKWLLPIGLLRLSFGGDSSSSNTTSTTSTDKRQVVEGGSIGITSDSSTVHVEALDKGIVTAALDVVKASDATSGDSLSKIIGLADKLFTGGFKSLESSQALTNDAYSRATTDKAGTIDNKTIAILGIAGAAAFALSRKKG